MLSETSAERRTATCPCECGTTSLIPLWHLCNCRFHFHLTFFCPNWSLSTWGAGRKKDHCDGNERAKSRPCKVNIFCSIFLHISLLFLPLLHLHNNIYAFVFDIKKFFIYFFIFSYFSFILYFPIQSTGSWSDFQT